MNPYALLTLIVGILAIFVTIIIQIHSSIDRKIEAKFQDPVFIRGVASEVRLPFLVFDEENRYLADTGASELIENIKIAKDGSDIKEIIVTPKKLLPIAPILESYDGDTEFDEPQRGTEFDWVYKAIVPETAWAKTYPSGKPPKKRFKLQIIEVKR